MRCLAYSTNCSFDMDKLSKQLQCNYSTNRIQEVLHITTPSNSDENGHVFFFAYGAIIFWGLTPEMESNFVEICHESEATKLGSLAMDCYVYEYANAEPDIVNDKIILPNKDIHTLLAFSHGLAQSVKLAGFEIRTQKLVDATKNIPEELAKYGKIRMSKKDLNKIIGQLFLERNYINLQLNFLDTPNFFWENTHLEHIYGLVVEYMDKESRLSIINQRLSLVYELFDMLNAEQHNVHASRLEWAIIWLIVSEVIISIVDISLKLG